MAGKYMKGALVSFMPTFIGSVPNVIVFQFNPETITHTWSAAAPDETRSAKDPLAVKGVPGEQFSFSLAVDASDMIADAAANPIGAALAFASGVYPRLAALEMLQYPIATPDQSLLGTVSESISNSGFGVRGRLDEKGQRAAFGSAHSAFRLGPAAHRSC